MAHQSFEQRMMVDQAEVIIIRSTRRRRTVSADVVGGVLRLRVPARTSEAEVVRHTREFRRRLVSRSGSRHGSDDQLLSRARQLSAQYLHGVPEPASVSWSSQQLRRWGSTTTSEGTIRLSARLQQMPEWVVDSVLVHELAHLMEPGHGAAFKKLVARYPRTTEADAFLAGVSWAEQHLPGGEPR